ncbi:MAG: XdhC family protein [Bacteroidota bacterium]
MMDRLYNIIAEIIRTSQKAALCTIVDTKGSTPLKAGAKMIVWENGKIFGSIGGGKLEQKTIEEAIEVIRTKTPQFYKHELLTQLQMCCGGRVEIFIEPLMAKKKLFIFGGGHVGKAMVKHLADLDFELFLVDSRAEIFEGIPETSFQKICGEYEEVLPSLAFDADSYIIIATHDHAHDRQILAYCIHKPHTYLGMIGSSNKIAKTREMFLSAETATEEELNQVDMPIGLEIHAESADEIAISIIAKLIKEKNTTTIGK